MYARHETRQEELSHNSLLTSNTSKTPGGIHVRDVNLDTSCSHE